MDSSFATHSGMLGLIATLLILALIGSTTLMHLISSLGRRSTRLGEQLSSTIERLQIEISERERDARIIQEAAREKEVLLREVHHRVKNNLQIISSIFNLQLRRTHDEGVRDLLKAACSRLQAISLLHQTLYRSKRLSDIAVVGYIREVVEHALNNFGVDQRIKIDVTSDEKALEVEKAIAIGLIITELIINSVKHAWPKDKNDTGTLPYGHIRLDIRRIDEYRARLDYGDDGVGLPPDFDIGTHHSLGMKLITILTKQLRGTLEVRQGVAKGSSFTVTFPIKYEEDEYGACANSDSRR